MLNRRQFLTASASALTAAATASKAEDMGNPRRYTFDLSEIEKAFPDPSAVPPLLKSFGLWLADKTWKSIGAFSLTPQWVDPQFAGSEHFYKDFALFVWLPTGSVAGCWLRDHPVAEAPIILLGTEGEKQVLAPNLESFLARIALGDFAEKGAAADFLYSDWNFEDYEVPDLRGQMQDLLRRETGMQDLAALAAAAKPEPSYFKDWVDQTETETRAELAKDPDFQAISDILAKYRPINAQSWDSTLIRINWAGDDFEGVLMQQGPKPLDEAEALKPHLAALRDNAARRTPGLGLWHYAAVMVYADQVEFRPDYMYQPEFLAGPPSPDAYRIDHARLPCEPRRIPTWLADILAT